MTTAIDTLKQAASQKYYVDKGRAVGAGDGNTRVASFKPTDIGEAMMVLANSAENSRRCLKGVEQYAIENGLGGLLEMVSEDLGIAEQTLRAAADKLTEGSE